MRPYIYAAILAGLTLSHYVVYGAGKQSVLARLQQDRIEIFQDGKRIDQDVLAADDDALYCMLVNCAD